MYCFNVFRCESIFRIGVWELESFSHTLNYSPGTSQLLYLFKSAVHSTKVGLNVLCLYSQFGIKCHGCVGCWSSSYFCARQKTWHSIPNWLYDFQQKTLQFVYSHIWKKEKTKHLTQLQLLWNKLTGRLACNVPLTWTHVRCFCMYWSFGLVDLACQT